jgi:uncharacterized protein (TIGR02246 family)
MFRRPFPLPEVSMKPRILPLLCVALFTVSCGGEATEDMSADAATEAAGDAMAETPSADEAALEQLRADYVQHYNMHHASVVADMYTDSAVWLSADGAVHEGKAAILASLEQAMAGTPTLSLTTRDMMTFDDWAVSIGDYGMQTTMPGGTDPIAINGHFMAGFHKVDGAWKSEGVITNYNAPPPEGMPAAPADDGELPAENGTMTDLITAYETHFNLGHADMVADLFTDDATVAFGFLPIGRGRTAVLCALVQCLALGDSPQVDLHDIYSMDFGDGWAFDSGWYTINATSASGTVGQTGTYMMLARQQADGSWKMHWMVSNAQPITG